MGLAKLDDAEFARRARERNNRVNAAHRQRMLEAGKAQTNVWLSAELRARLDHETTVTGNSLSAVVEVLLMDGLAYRQACDDAPSLSADSKPIDRDQQILELKHQGLSGYAIAGQVGVSEPTVRRALKRMKEVEATT